MTKEERKEYNKKYRKDNKDRINANTRKRRAENPAIFSACQQRYRAGHREKINKLSKKYADVRSYELSDYYVKAQIIQRFDILSSEITQKMIELKRVQLLNKRLIKNLKQK